jgi:tight adherence protein B
MDYLAGNTMLQTALVSVLVAMSIGGLFQVFLAPYFNGEKKTEERRDNLTRGKSRAKSKGQTDQDKRRKQIEESLKRLEEKKSGKQRIPFSLRLQRAGMSASPALFIVFSALFGLLLAAIVFFMVMPLWAIPAAFFVGAVGLPRWFLNFRKKRREAKFLKEFPSSIDIVVRGMKAGLPLNDCIRMIAREAPEPIGPEFREIIEAQKLGVALDEGLVRLYERVPLPEVNFLAIVVAIQAKSGGNLSEALGNLSNVLRERKKMKDKIKAVSQEAKSSAAIIASLPFLVMGGIYAMNPDYMTLLFTETAGNYMLAGGAFWMLCGVLVMRQMINFDF